MVQMKIKIVIHFHQVNTKLPCHYVRVCVCVCVSVCSELMRVHDSMIGGARCSLVEC